MNHVENARRLLEIGDRESLTYAALEVRMAIEEAFYALVPHYSEELPAETMKKWQPRHLIDALLECNPMVEQYQALIIHDPQHQERVLFSGQQQPVTRKLLRDFYQRLGSCLHATMPGQEERDTASLRTLVQEALGRIEQHCRETTVIHNGGIFLTFHASAARSSSAI